MGGLAWGPHSGKGILLLLHLLISASRARLQEGLLDPSTAPLFRNTPFNLKDTSIDVSASIHLTASSCLCGHGRDAFISPLKSQAAGRCPRRLQPSGPSDPAVLSLSTPGVCWPRGQTQVHPGSAQGTEISASPVGGCWSLFQCTLMSPAGPPRDSRTP